MSYEETVNYLFTKLPLFSRIGAAAYKEDISNTVLLCDAIGNPQNKIKTVHIAGTNGKGSTSHMLAAIFQQNGFKTGLYTSPHLKDFRERIKVNGEVVNKDFIVEFVKNIKEVSERIEPSFFEITVAMALSYFDEQKVDIAIMETGLGGRLDSTNIINPELSIITNIGFDHMNILGETLEKIAFEKAGIIKYKTPVIIGETLPETKPVFISKTKEMNAPVIFAEESFSITNTNLFVDNLEVEIVKNKSGKIKQYLLDLNGIYQQKNLRTVLTAIEQLGKKGFQFKTRKITQALVNVKKLTGLYGRWDVVSSNPMVVLDVAHNEDGIKQLIQQLELCNYKSLHIIFGMVKDKDASKMLSLLPKHAYYYFTKAQIPRALPENELAEKAREYSLSGNKFAEVNIALEAAMHKAAKKDLILICGSVFVVGEVSHKYFRTKIPANVDPGNQSGTNLNFSHF